MAVLISQQTIGTSGLTGPVVDLGISTNVRVVWIVSGGAGGDSLNLKVQSSNDPSGPWTFIGSSANVQDEASNGNFVGFCERFAQAIVTVPAGSWLTEATIDPISV